MRIYTDFATEEKEVMIDNMIIFLKDGTEIDVTWDSSDWCTNKDGIVASRCKGVYFDDDDTNGKLESLVDDICAIELAIHTESGNDFVGSIDMEICDGDFEYDVPADIISVI